MFIFAVAVFLGSFRVPEDRARCGILEYIGKYLTMWIYVFFAGTNFIVRYFFQAFADSEFICEVLGPIIALLLAIAFAFGFHLLLMHLSQKKAAKASVAE